MSSMPPARFEAETRGGAATIGKAVKVVGQIFSREDLYVDGEVEGTVEALEHKLTIGPERDREGDREGARSSGAWKHPGKRGSRR